MKIRKGSKELIKDINRYKVINILREHPWISRAEIASNSGLRQSTLTYILDELMSQQVIVEVGESLSTGGRRAKLLEFNKNYGLIAAVKIEEVRSLVAITNMDGQILKKSEILYKEDPIPEDVVNMISQQIKWLLNQVKKEKQSLMGIGVLSSGLVNREEGFIIRSSILGWANIPIAKMLEKEFPNLPVFVDKNINGYALAELWVGKGKELKNFALVSVGAGLGLSIVMNRRIYYGAIGGAGEYGHTIIQVGGYPCHCGQRGCLEMYASEFYFKNKMKELLPEYPETILRDFLFENVSKSVEKKDALAIRLMHEMSEYLGYGILNLINTLNPETVIVAGEGMEYEELFMPKVKEIVRENFFSKAEIYTDIRNSKLSSDAWLTGAALLAINHLFKVPIFEADRVRIY
ncbi:ROK family transcriptional regulator [Bacillus sp. 03113]|uniref:ROK family transcriptional regulator n=1 Tax=Bacillus sp. 03113 TaxID=2578211 RepID=UPI001143E6B0|nr:ROK family transcriptional regulator [Bacillus sp. 03113]